MIVKEELIPWFKNLKSYRRIDIMCTLLNLCLPFELRFLGTHLEELGRRDAKNLRSAELRVNNPQEFVTDVSSLLTGQPTETKVRRQMALYLALLRVCNRTGVNELFKILDRWGDLDFGKFESDPLQELLLVYTMAHNHPVFSFEQRHRCGEIFVKINQTSSSSTASTSPIASTTPLSSSNLSHQQLLLQHQQPQSALQATSSPPPPPQQQFQTALFPQPPPTLINAAQQQQQSSQQIPNVMMFQPPTMAQIIPGDSLLVEMPSQMMPIPTEFATPAPWQYRPVFLSAMDNQFPPQATSPHLSQPSSPTQSRTGSPSRQNMSQNQVHHQQSNLRSNRHRSTRPTTESTPPPPLQQQQQQQNETQQQVGQGSQGGATVYMTNDIIKNYEDINMEGAITQLQSLQLRNGYNRNASTIPRQHKHHHHHQQQHQHQQPIHHTNAGGWTTATMSQPPPNYNPNMRLIEMKKGSSVNTQSESGGSSNGEASPPPESTSATTVVASTIPGRHGGKHMSSSRLNGNNAPPDFNGGTPTAAIVTSNSTGNLQMMMAPSQMHFQTAPPPTYRTTQPPPPQGRQPQFQAQPNGEMILQFQPFMPAPQSTIMVSTAVPQQQQQRVSPATNQVQVVAPFPTNKIIQSCFNCGSTAHTGLNCPEASMEDVTRNSLYKLDYMSTPPTTVKIGSTPTSVPMTSSMSSTSSLNSQPPTQDSIESADQSIPIIIDLTQDTTSNSSSSSTSSIHGSSK